MGIIFLCCHTLFITLTYLHAITLRITTKPPSETFLPRIPQGLRSGGVGGEISNVLGEKSPSGLLPRTSQPVLDPVNNKKDDTRTFVLLIAATAINTRVKSKWPDKMQ